MRFKEALAEAEKKSASEDATVYLNKDGPANDDWGLDSVDTVYSEVAVHPDGRREALTRRGRDLLKRMLA